MTEKRSYATQVHSGYVVMYYKEWSIVAFVGLDSMFGPGLVMFFFSFGKQTWFSYEALFSTLMQVINISSPNTPGLRKLQGRKQLKDLVKKVCSCIN